MSFSEQTRRDSFLLSNVIAQPAGAVFPDNPERLGAGRVAVSSELYKVVLVLAKGRTTLSAVIIPNVHSPSDPLDSFTVPLAEVEKRTGLTFFPNLTLRIGR